MYATTPNGPGWRLRAVPNKFPALQIEGDLDKAGEGIGELLVETVEPANVGEDDDADCRGIVRRRGEGRELGSIGRTQDEVLM